MDKRVLCLENLVGYIFIIKGKVGKKRRLPSSSSFVKMLQKMRCKRMVMLQSPVGSWDRPPSEGPGLQAGKIQG